jgi:hypothetical protein
VEGSLVQSWDTANKQAIAAFIPLGICWWRHCTQLRCGGPRPVKDPVNAAYFGSRRVQHLEYAW